MRAFLALCLLISGALAVTPAVAAQRENRPPNVKDADLLTFDKFLDEHLNIEKDLARDWMRCLPPQRLPGPDRRVRDLAVG